MRRSTLAILALCCACARDVRLVDNEVDDIYEAGAARRPADVLLVVDNSPSMVEEQSKLADDIDDLIDAAVETEADVQFGVITTEATGDEAGLLRGGVLMPGDDLEDELRAALDVGVHGGRDERGLDAIALALDGRNDGFRRDDAMLELLVFSDEDDQSDVDLDDWWDDMWRAWGRDVRVHGVVGDLPSGCFSRDGAANQPTRYVDLIGRSEGFQASICGSSYRDVLDALGLQIAGIHTTFPLSFLPDPETLAVTVDGETVESDHLTGWTYEPAPNAVVFHGSSIPEPGQQVLITYIRLGQR